MWHDPEQLGLTGALVVHGARCGVLVCAGGHNILIFSLLFSLTFLIEFRYSSELSGRGAPFSPVHY